MSDFANCASCGARIIWIEDQNGTRIPLNRVRARVYDYVDREGYAPVFMQDSHGKPLLYHISHFLTCPNASRHSKQTTGGTET